MKKFWKIFTHEYLRHVLRARFIWALLSVPLLIILSGGIGVLSAISSVDKRPTGIIDQSGLNLEVDPATIKEDGPFGKPEFIFFQSTAEAETELTGERIQAYYVVPADYLQTGKVEYHTTNEAGYGSSDQFSTILKTNLVKDQSPEVRQRILEGLRINSLSMKTNKPHQVMDFLFPLASGLFLVIAMNITSGYLIQAMTEEKENRTMEILITSVSPAQLLTGKLAAIISVGLTQMAVWMIALLIGLKVLSGAVGGIGSLAPDPKLMVVEILLFLLAFIALSALVVLIGISAAEASEAQGVAAIFSLILFVPIWLLWLLISQPNSPASVVMSLLPLTSPIAMPTRMSLLTVPDSQILASLLIALVFAAGSIWLAIKSFRLGMLRYGKKLSLREVLNRGA
ncbi:MAG TPA: ABC transporter permease [Bellilinea sp.]|nr:ABC transporter permease [Bellilinea sp.]